MGFRTHDEDGALDTMSLDEYLIENKEATFMLRAKSDSMKEAGILCGDLVIIDRAKEPRTGDIVVAVADGGFTLRRFSGSQRSEIKVEAVVTAVVRKY